MREKKHHNIFIVTALMTAALLGSPTETLADESGTWGLDLEKNKWQFFYEPEEPVCDEWIVYYGKEYYLDSKGYMKTGWVKNKEDGNKYYMGEDGAKCFNCYVPDGSYVGPDGVRLERFDKFRDRVKKELKTFKNGNYLFLLEDLNGDEYPDLAVMSRNTAAAEQAVPAGEGAAFLGQTTRRQLLSVSIWDPDKEKLVTASDADPDEAEQSWLSYNPQTEDYWMVIRDNKDTSHAYFVLDEDSAYFEQYQSFTMDKNDWGDLLYLIDGEEEDEELWREELSLAEEETGIPLDSRFLPLSEEAITLVVDRVPTEDEVSLWQG